MPPRHRTRDGLPLSAWRVPWSDVLDALAELVGQHVTIQWIADRAGVDRRTVHRWATEGMPFPQFDRFIVGLGHLPFEVWDDYDLVGVP